MVHLITILFTPFYCVFQMNVRIIEASIIIDMVGRSLSLLCLLVSVSLLLCVSPLRVKLKQNDYLKLHLNLFVAVICLNTFTVIMDVVYLDGLTSPDPIHRHNAVSSNLWFTS